MVLLTGNTALYLVKDLILCDLLGDQGLNDFRLFGFSLPHPMLCTTIQTRQNLPQSPGEFVNLVAIRPSLTVFCVGITTEPLYLGFEPFFDRPRTHAEIIANMGTAEQPRVSEDGIAEMFRTPSKKIRDIDVFTQDRMPVLNFHYEWLKPLYESIVEI